MASRSAQLRKDVTDYVLRYEGAAGTDHGQQAQAVVLFLTDTLIANLTA
jgi:hypothetical protein